MADTKISALTELAAEPATDDAFPVVDTSVTTTKKILWSTIKAIFALAAKGVTNGDSHDHAGGDGAAIVEAAITLADNTTLNASTSAHGLLVKATAPAAGLYNYVGLTNGETTYTNKALFDATDPSTQAFSDAAAVGTAATAARRDHKHGMPAAAAPKLDDCVAPDDNTDLNASTTAHGLLLKATAPAANLLNVVGIANGETVYANKAIFDATNPAAVGTAAPGTALTAAHRDHVHAAPAADLTTPGIIEVATAAETTTGTDAGRAVSPDGLAGSDYGKRVVGVLVVDPATNTATGDGKAFFRVPAVLNGYNLVAVAMSVYTAGTTNTTDVQIRNVTDSVDMLSTKLTIDSTEVDTSTAATAAVIDATHDDVATGDRIAIDVDAIHTTPAKGLYVELTFQLP